jgi:hypothetical protein
VISAPPLLGAAFTEVGVPGTPSRATFREHEEPSSGLLHSPKKTVAYPDELVVTADDDVNVAPSVKALSGPKVPPRRVRV